MPKLEGWVHSIRIRVAEDERAAPARHGVGLIRLCVEKRAGNADKDS